MSTQTAPRPPLAADIAALLARLRSRIRLYVWIEGLAVLVAGLGLAFWITWLLDQPWALELPRTARIVALAVVGIAMLWLAYRFIFRRAFVRLADRSMALLLERRFNHFGDSLLTAVELNDRPDSADGTSGDMLAHTFDEARAQIGSVRIGQVFDLRPLVHALLAAVVLAGSVAAYAAARSDDFNIWFRRTLLLSEELWPRKTELIVEGFQNGVAKIARGADFQVIAKANTQKLVPDLVQIRYRNDEGFRGRENMTRDGVARPEVDPYQQFSHTFQGVLTPIRLDVIGGDARQRNLRIEVVESPTLMELTLEAVYPKYMGREPRTLPVTGAMQLPEGVRLSVKARSNKDLVEVDIQAPGGEPVDGGPAAVQLFPQQSGGDPRAFEFDLGELRADRTLLFSLLDTDGIRNREPIRLTVGMTPDETPQVAVQLRGIGSAITPSARIPVSGQLTDDHGLVDIWFSYVIDDQQDAAGRLPLATKPRGRDDIAFGAQDEEAIDVRDQLTDADEERISLKPGQKLQLSVKAEDAYDLGAAPHIGSSQRFLLDVVTPDQLRTLLESRELNLRQRFEAIIAEVTETSESLTRLDFSNSPPAGENEQPPAAAAPDDDAPPPLKSAELTVLRVERTQQNSRKNAQETIGIAASFEEITAELVNNRVDTEELKLRLTDGISQPLRRIGEEMFPELERRLTILRKQLADPQQSAAERDLSRQQADAILLEMRQVLNRMVELETFNEALAMLRAIIESQDKINELTDELRKKKAKELLDD